MPGLPSIPAGDASIHSAERLGGSLPSSGMVNPGDRADLEARTILTPSLQRRRTLIRTARMEERNPTELQRMAGLLDRAGGGDAWHGPSVAAVFSTLTASQASVRPVAGAHTIWELALHIAVWNRVVARRLGGETVEPSPAEDWPPPGAEADDDAWERTLTDLRDARATLRTAILAFDERRLEDIVPGRDHTFYVMIHGVIQHDLYHAGQVAQLRKALA